MQQQQSLLSDSIPRGGAAFKMQLLKWIGNKQTIAPKIISYFPDRFHTYFEPFLGSGGVLGVLAPGKGIASDTFRPLMEIWQTLRSNPKELVSWYTERFNLIRTAGKERAYQQVLASYNSRPNGADLVFLCRACYGGVVRFRQSDGYMSTPVGVHNPVSPESFGERVNLWFERTLGTDFINADYTEALKCVRRGDLVYCDPPYSDSQTILYGAQTFSLVQLFSELAACRAKGAFIALSIDGTKYSGRRVCDVPVPAGLFEREVFIRLGRSMLKRFQMDGQSLDEHEVSDRLLLSY
jgi:DNA adenine methylase